MNKILKENSYYLDNIVDYLEPTSSLGDDYGKKLIHFITGQGEMSAKEQLRIDILENEVIGILEKDRKDFDKKDQIIYDKARRFYTKFFNNVASKYQNDLRYLTILCQSSIFSNGYPAKLFDFNTLNKVKQLKNNIYNLILNLCDKFSKDPTSLNPKQIDLLFTFLKKNIDNPNFTNFNHNMASIIINTDESKIRFSQRLFLVEYLNNWKCKSKNIEPAKVYVTNKDLYDENENYGCSFGETGLVVICKDLVNNKRDKETIYNKFFLNGLEMSIPVTLHELEHYYQASCKKNNAFNYENFIYSLRTMLTDYLSTKEYDEYKTNYSFMETEREANKNGWREFGTFCNKHNSSNKIRNAATLAYRGQYYGNSFARKATSTGEVKEKSLYNTAMIKEILEKHPDAISKYPIMRVFLNKNNKFISFEEIIKELCYHRLKSQNGTKENNEKEYNTEQSLLEIYGDTIFWYLFEGPRIDFSKLNVQEKKYYCTLVADYYFAECRKIKDRMDFYQNDLYRYKLNPTFFESKVKKDFEGFDNETAVNISRVKKMYHYLMSLSDDISLVAPEIKSYGKLDKVQINFALATFRSRIDECGLTNSKLASEISSLTDLYESYGRSNK